jgi:hypothetical protein
MESYQFSLQEPMIKSGAQGRGMSCKEAFVKAMICLLIWGFSTLSSYWLLNPKVNEQDLLGLQAQMEILRQDVVRDVAGLNAQVETLQHNISNTITELQDELEQAENMTLPRCDPLPNPSSGRSSCLPQGPDGLGPVADGTSVCHLSCNIGYGFPNADATAYQTFQSLTCQEDGSWSATPSSSCQPINCQAFPAPTGGLQITPAACAGKDPISALSYQICTFSCTIGTMSGSGVRVCGADGVWSGQDAFCRTVR